METHPSLTVPVARAVELGLPSDLARRAERTALRAVAASGQSWSARRLEAYFWGVVRRAAFRGGDRTREIRMRYLRASAIADARRAGAA